MYAEESPAAPSAVEKPHLVDLQHQEIESHRTAVLNRETVRMSADGWSVQRVGDHLVATRLEAGRSQMERSLLGVLGMLALAYAAILFVPDEVANLPISKPLFLVAAVVVGLLGAYLSREHAGGEHRVSVSVDGQGRPFQTELRTRDF
jgi:hypothetical protein